MSCSAMDGFVLFVTSLTSKVYLSLIPIQFSCSTFNNDTVNQSAAQKNDKYIKQITM